MVSVTIAVPARPALGSGHCAAAAAFGQGPGVFHLIPFIRVDLVAVADGSGDGQPPGGLARPAGTLDPSRP